MQFWLGGLGGGGDPINCNGYYRKPAFFIFFTGNCNLQSATVPYCTVLVTVAHDTIRYVRARTKQNFKNCVTYLFIVIAYHSYHAYPLDRMTLRYQRTARWKQSQRGQWLLQWMGGSLAYLSSIYPTNPITSSFPPVLSTSPILPLVPDRQAETDKQSTTLKQVNGPFPSFPLLHSPPLFCSPAPPLARHMHYTPTVWHYTPNHNVLSTPPQSSTSSRRERKI